MGVYKSEAQKLSELRAKYPLLDFSESKYNGCHGMLTAVCPKHGVITKKANHWNVNGCPKCGYEKMVQPTAAREAGFKKTTQALIAKGRKRWAAWLAANSHRIESNVEDYTGMEKLTPVRCVIHNYSYEARPANFINQDSGCIHCGMADILRAVSSTPERRLKKARSIHGERYEYPDPIMGSNDKVRIICKAHGEFIQDFHNHITGAGCPKCSHRVSKQEIEVAEFLKSLGANVEIQNRKLIAPAELDIWLPDLNTAIEYNGSHWHADDNGRKNTQLAKYKRCQEKGIRLVSIMDFEWNKHQSAVKGLLRAVVRQQTSVGARSTELLKIQPTEARKFLDVHHITGFIGAQLHLGIYREGELIGVASFGQSRFEADTFELLRYATSCHVVGGLAKTVKVAQAELGFNKLTSYCDLRHGTGKAYAGAGFTLDSTTPPNYWWFNATQHLTRYQTQKHKLAARPEFAEYFDESKTEAEICEAAGFRKISGVGHQKWVWSSN